MSAKQPQPECAIGDCEGRQTPTSRFCERHNTATVLESSSKRMAREIREQGRALRVWAARLREAEICGEWSKVGEVRADLAVAALAYDELAEKTAGGRR